jgi:hypothetical protein
MNPVEFVLLALFLAKIIELIDLFHLRGYADEKNRKIY